MIGIDVTRAVMAWSIDSVVVLTPLLLVAWMLDRFGLRPFDPRLAHGVWLIVLVRLLVPPSVLPWPLAAGRVEAPPAGPWLSGAAEASALSPGAALFAAWSAGVLIVVVTWCVRASIASRRLSAEKGAVPAAWAARLVEIIDEARLARRPSVLVDPLTFAPYVTGLVHPRLVLPPRADAWPPSALEHAVRHELAHLRRRDLWVEAAWMAACAVYWFHPLVHVARRRAYDARELCCDAEVAAVVGPDYRESLLRMAARQLDGPVVTPPQHGWHPILWRLKALEQLPARRSRLATLIGGAALVVLAMACLVPHVRVAAGPAPATDLSGLVDPTIRLEMGRGSLHVRYALMEQMNARESTR